MERAAADQRARRVTSRATASRRSIPVGWTTCHQHSRVLYRRRARDREARTVAVRQHPHECSFQAERSLWWAQRLKKWEHGRQKKHVQSGARV